MFQLNLHIIVFVTILAAVASAQDCGPDEAWTFNITNCSIWRLVNNRSFTIHATVKQLDIDGMFQKKFISISIWCRDCGTLIK